MDNNKNEKKLNTVFVMLSSFNGEKYISEQIDSILNQSECKVMLRVRDDGSNDKTVEILKDYEKKGKLEWYQGENKKPAQSFLELLYNAPSDCDYYAFSDQDDVWDERKLLEAIDALKSVNNEALYFCNGKLVDAELNDINQETNNFLFKPNLAGLLCGGGIQGAAMVMNNKLAKKFIGFEQPSFVKMHDHYVSCVCSAIDGRIIYDKNAYLMYRQHDQNVLGVNRSFFTTIKKRIYMIMDKRNLHDVVKTSNYILKEYGDFIPQKNKDILKTFASYKDSFRKRIKAARLDGIGNGRRNLAITAKLSILLKRI